jgi:hypothetical protein
MQKTAEPREAVIATAYQTWRFTVSVQIVMDLTGDTRHEFSPEDKAAVTLAEERFKKLTGQGFTAAEKTGPGTSKLVREFNPDAAETLFMPRLIGG